MNLHLNFLKMGYALHADVIINLFKKFQEDNTHQGFFITYCWDKYQIETVHAILIWQCFDVVEGYHMREYNIDRKI